MNKRILFILVFFLMVGCSSTEAEPTPAPSNTARPATQTYTPEPPTPTPTQTPEPLPITIPDPYEIGINDDGWLQYINHLNRLSVLLPPDWAVIDFSTGDSSEAISLLLDQNQELGSLFSTEYLTSLASSGVVFMAIEGDADAIESGSMANFNLVIGDLPYDLTLDEYLELSLDQLMSVFGEGFEISHEEAVLGGKQAVKLTYELEGSNINGEQQVVVSQQYLMLNGRTQYVFTMTTPKERTAELADTIGNIVNSFENFTVLHVKADGTNPYCDSWENACALHTAIFSARPGDEIWVQAGLYTPAADPSSPSFSFWLRSGVAIYGGFTGTETSREARDWEANLTILSGDIGRDDITDANGMVTDPDNIVGENSYHVVNASNADATAVLDGFVITAGYASETPPDLNGYGGGMVMQSGSPTLTNLVFSANTAGKGAAYHGGGGMYISFGSNPVLTHVTFIGNTAGGGAGMFVDRGSNPVLEDVLFTGNRAIDASCMGNYAGSSPVLNNVIFDGNISSNKGCMANQENSNPVLTNVTFSNNTAMHGGAMYNYLSSPTLTDVAFINNEARNVGGGMKNETNCSPILTNVLFSGNTAFQGGGGMINMGNSNPVLTNVAFINNTANTTTGGGMDSSDGSSPTLTNVTFSGNYAMTGGGLSIWQGDLTMTNVTFSENTAGRDGAAMYIVDSSATITNSIVWGNTPIGTQLLNESARITITHSIVAGISAGSGNMNRNPLLGELADNGGFTPTYALQPDSPAIDSGSLSICPSIDQRDLPRPADGDGDGSAMCDIGAYEYQVPE